MKLITKISLLLLLFVSTHSFAINPATQTKAAVSFIDVINEKPTRGAKRAILKKLFKQKIAALKTKEKKERVINKDIESKNHTLATAALVCGILGILLFGVLSIFAIIFGAIALKKIKNSGGFYTGKGMARAGLILGIVVIGLIILVLGTFILLNTF